MDVASVGSAGLAAQQSRATLAENFDTFLTLLTAQLSNQDPLNPVDSSQFTQQLVQYSQVEQQISTNSQLEALLDQQKAANLASSATFLGRTAEIETATALLGEDGAVWNYEIDGAVGDVKLTVLDAAGRPVHQGTAYAGAGAGVFEWDGDKIGGGSAAPGPYRLLVSAKDANGDAITPKVSVRAAITGVEPGANGTTFITPLGRFDFAQVLKVEA